EQVLEAIEHNPEAELDGAHAERDGQVRLPDTRRSLDEQRAVLADPVAGGERLDAPPLEGGLEREVEVRQGLARGQRREYERGPPPTLVAGTPLLLEQPVQEPMRRRLLGDRLAEPGRELLAGVHEAKLHQALARDVDVHGRVRRARLHRATSASAA